MRWAFLVVLLPGFAWAQGVPTIHLMGSGGGGKVLQLQPDEAAAKAPAVERKAEAAEEAKEAAPAAASVAPAVAPTGASATVKPAAEKVAKDEKAAGKKTKRAVEPAFDTPLPQKLTNTKIRARALSPRDVSTSKGKSP